MDGIRPTLGRIVIYTTEGRNFPWKPQQVPAVVARVNEDGSCGLALLYVSGEQAQPVPEEGMGKVKQGTGPHTWAWPAVVELQQLGILGTT